MVFTKSRGLQVLKATKNKLQEPVQNGIENNSRQENGECSEHISKKQRIQEKIVYDDLDTNADNNRTVQHLNLSKVYLRMKLTSNKKFRTLRKL